MTAMPHITLENVSVDLPIYDAGHRSLRRTLVGMGLGGSIRRQGRRTVVQALHNIELHSQQGDQIGLIGPNGAGKSTLLRVMAGICEPSSGHATIQGSVSTLLSMSSILDPEMTGYENIEHGALLLNIPAPRRRRLAQEIADFTQLDAFLHMPVRTYSAGMQVRLSFALLTSQEPDILLLDELMGVGDAAFVERATKRILDLRQKSKILITASHVNQNIRRLCTKVLWLDQGRIVQFGPTDAVLDAYAALVGG